MLDYETILEEMTIAKRARRYVLETICWLYVCFGEIIQRTIMIKRVGALARHERTILPRNRWFKRSMAIARIVYDT